LDHRSVLVRRASLIALFGNPLLAGLKIASGIIASSRTMPASGHMYLSTDSGLTFNALSSAGKGSWTGGFIQQ
jgi:divalent metal cation (Fe/Co/Zn/Cd) transporter